jgi:hypothetical protein
MAILLRARPSMHRVARVRRMNLLPGSIYAIATADGHKSSRAWSSPCGLALADRPLGLARRPALWPASSHRACRQWSAREWMRLGPRSEAGTLHSGSWLVRMRAFFPGVLSLDGRWQRTEPEKTLDATPRGREVEARTKYNTRDPKVLSSFHRHNTGIPPLFT